MAAIFFLCILIGFGAGSSKSATPTPKPTVKATPLTKAQRLKLEQMKNSAPADEYFGKMKLSYLGINNTFRDQAIRAGDHTTDSTVANAVHWAEDAMNSWRRKYLHDPQLARSLYLAFLADRKIWIADYQQRATLYLVELRKLFPKTFFGKVARADLKNGMTMNIYAVPQPCDSSAPTNQPLPVPTDDPANHIKVNMIPAPCYTPTALTSPTASASPTLAPQHGRPVATPSRTPMVAPTSTESPNPAFSPTATNSAQASPS